MYNAHIFAELQIKVKQMIYFCLSIEQWIYLCIYGIFVYWITDVINALSIQRYCIYNK